MGCGLAPGWPWGGAGGGVPINTAFPYGQVFVPAAYMIPAASNAPTVNLLQIAARPQRIQTLQYPGSVARYAYFNFAWDRKEIDTTPVFTVYPVWFQQSDTTAPSPAEYVKWSTAITNKRRGGSLDVDMTGNAVTSRQIVLDKWKIACGDESDPLMGLGNNTINGDAISATECNYLTVMIARRGDLSDTYADPAELLGAVLQWKNNFSNVTAIPRKTTF